MDRWDGTFPAEEAAKAWAAIDALARQYVTDGHCATIERGRAKALTDLVAGNATITTALTVTVPTVALTMARTSLVGGLEPDAASPGPVAGSLAAAPQPAPGHAVPGPGAGDLVEVTGPAAGQPVLVSLRWLTEAVESGTTRVTPCHPVTGALVSGDAIVGGGAYRPSARTAKRIRARDRRCRFPGCSVGAVFCDLDDVRPWPAGRTTDDNLLCLCRRHHRVKQRPGWRVTLTPHGVATWTDPTGRVRTTHPVDALDTTILTASPTRRGESTAPVSTSRARSAIPDGPHTELEFRLEHLATTPVSTTGGRRHRHPPHTSWRDNGTRHGVELTPTTELIVLDHITTPCRRPRRRGRHVFPEEPPF